MLRTATVSFGAAEELDQDDIEAMCASLMEQGYIKAYIWQSKGMLVLQKGERLGFPPVSSVRMIGDDAWCQLKTLVWRGDANDVVVLLYKKNIITAWHRYG